MNETFKKAKESASQALDRLVKPIYHKPDYAASAGRRESLDGDWPEGEGPDVELS